MKIVRPILRRMEQDPAFRGAFYDYIGKVGVKDFTNFSMRLYNTVKLGQPPAAFTFALLTEFEKSYSTANPGRHPSSPKTGRGKKRR